MANRSRLGSFSSLPVWMQTSTSWAGRVALSEIVGVVGRDDREVELPGEVDHRVVDGLVELQPVVLDLQVETVFEDLLELGALRPRPVDLAVHHQVGEGALGAGGTWRSTPRCASPATPCPRAVL